jgi:drug/metabolite transporter (DMT)-like permease
MFLHSLTARPYFLLTLTALLWAGNAIAGKLAVDHISPAFLTTLRWLIASMILLPFAQRYLQRDWPVIRANLAFLVIMGTVGFALFNNLIYLALNYTTAINASIEQGAMPLFVFILNFLFFQMHPRPLQIAGFVLTLSGIVLTVSGGELIRLLELDFNIGDVIMIIAVMLYGIYSVALTRKPAMHWLSFITTLAVAAFIVSIPFSVGEFYAGRFRAPDMQGWGVAIFTGIFPSIVAQSCWVRGLEIIGSNRGGIFINLVPIFAAFLAIVLLGERFYLHHAAALILVISGVWLAQMEFRRVSGAGR